MAKAKADDINLGDRVSDRISKFTGIVTSITTYLNGCVRFAVNPEKLGKDGDIVEGRIFDYGDLDLVKKRVIQPVTLVPITALPPSTAGTTGGPAREGRGFRTRGR